RAGRAPRHAGGAGAPAGRGGRPAGELPVGSRRAGQGRARVISFVGAGPGAPDLLTLRGAERLRRADVVVWASSLVPEAVLSHCRPDAVLHDSAVMTL